MEHRLIRIGKKQNEARSILSKLNITNDAINNEYIISFDTYTASPTSAKLSHIEDYDSECGLLKRVREIELKYLILPTQMVSYNDEKMRYYSFKEMVL